MPQVCSASGLNFSVLNGNLDLRVPAVLADARADVPDAVPVAVRSRGPSFDICASHFAPRGIDRELVAVALVVERVDDDLEAVGVAGVEVLAQLVDDDLAGLGILGEHADVERAIVVEQPDFGVEGGRLALARIVLDEALGDRRRRPRRLIELAVERDGAAGSGRGAASDRAAPCCSRSDPRRPVTAAGPLAMTQR